MKKLIFVLILCILQMMNIFAQIVSSGKVSVLINNKAKPEVKQNLPVVSEPNTSTTQTSVGTEVPIAGGKYYALIIGINNYSDPLINELDYCIRYATSFYNTLITRYTFEKDNVTFLKNATKSDIVSALDHFSKVVQPADNFLIFYAGHGYWDESSEVGFWIPYDARKESNLAWFSNNTLLDYLSAIHSKHTLLITDACFGGSSFKPGNAFMNTTMAVNKLYELPSRKAMTSGTLTEGPDQRAFLKYMIERLDKNSEKYLPSEQLFSNFRIAVINNSNIKPLFGEIKDTGDEGGDFIFILR
ncbi:MAG: caspase family protein [Bacteroidales bacterium]|jgi:hypothetical protein